MPSAPPASGARCHTHPETPSAGTCTRCGTFGCGACLSETPAGVHCDRCLASVRRLPWDSRAEVGLFKAWALTAWAMVARPAQTLRDAGPEGSLGSSLLFAAIAVVVGNVPTLLFYGLVFLLGDTAPEVKAIENQPILVAGAMFYPLVLLGAQLGAVLFSSALDQVLLLVLGARPRSFSVTVRASALSMGPYVVGLVPVCGMYVVPLWALVLRIIGLSTLHQTTGGKASAAVLLPPVLCCGLAAIALVAALTLGAASN
jgi:hypothetical protein